MTGAALTRTQHLTELIEEATVDCYDEEEQATGSYTTIGENLALPFKTPVPGITADVVGIDMDDTDGWLPSARRQDRSGRPAFADTVPAGAEWIAPTVCVGERRSGRP